MVAHFGGYLQERKSCVIMPMFIINLPLFNGKKRLSGEQCL